MSTILHSNLIHHHSKFLHKDSQLILQDNTVLCLSNNPIQYVTSIDQVPLQDIHQVQYAEDATLVRLYHDSIQWIVSTRNTIDAKESHFASTKSFDTLFWDIWNTYKFSLTSLHKDSTYFFLLIHPLHQHVLRHSHKKLILVDVLSQKPSSYIHSYHFHCPVITSLENYTERKDKRGLLFLSSHTKYLLDFTHFTQLKSLRGRTPSLLFRFLQLYKQPQRQAAFVHAFPHHSYQTAHHILVQKVNPKKHSPRHLLNLLS